MKKKFLCLFSVYLIIVQPLISSKVNFDYKLKIDEGIMHVLLNYTPVTPDSTTFQYGCPYGGMNDLFNSFVNLKSSARFKIKANEKKVTFYYQNNNPFEITYDIIDTHKPEHKVVGEMFRPIINRNYFFALSTNLFLTPQLEKTIIDSLYMSVTLHKNPIFQMYFSFKPELKPEEKFVLKLSEGLDALITGASDLHVEKRESAGIKNYVVLRIDENNNYNLKRFMDYFDTFLLAMNEFWGNLNGTYYTLVASKFQDINYHSISGTAFKGGFHVKFSGDTILANKDVMITVSHEIMHRYIGSGCITLGDDNEWFNEGFTDYTTWYLLSECGLISKADFKNIISVTYNNLLQNPFRNTSNAEIQKHFWENHYYEKLPYNRGALFAAYIDNRINEIYKSKKSYRDFMYNLKSFAENKNKELSVEDFILVASSYIPKDEIKKLLELYMIKGEIIPEKLILTK